MERYFRPVPALLLLFFLLLYGCVKEEDGDISPAFSVDKLQFSSGSGMRFFDVLSPGPWSLSVPGWLVCSPVEGTGDATVMAMADANTGNDRSGEVVLTSGGVSVSIPVSQAGEKGPGRANTAPTYPVPVSPAEGDSDVKINTVFRWQESTDADGDEITYIVEVSYDNGENWLAMASSTGSGIKADYLLEKDADCLWRVRAVDGFGGDAASAAVAFGTGEEGGWLDGEVFELQHESAGAPEPVHLVFTGDGFVSSDWAEDGKFMEDVEKAVEAIFEVEPYRSYREYFRISAVAAHSMESGATVQEDMGYLGPMAQRKHTVFSSTLAGGGDTYIDGNDDLVREYAMKVPGIGQDDLKNTSVFILVNVNAYAGTCHAFSSGFSACYCPLGTMYTNGQPAYKAIIVHEGAGHGFGCLQDEYVYYNGTIDDYSVRMYEIFREANPLSSWNVSLTGDRDEVHWNHYFGRPGYESVGMYEGAMLYAKGVWRPEEVSCMDDNRPYFNAPSREAIVRRIFHIAGLEFDLEDFIARDVVKSDPTGLSSAATKAPEMVFPPLDPPVYIED